jgi:outer membrane receptor protein involved in Fe transport
MNQESRQRARPAPWPRRLGRWIVTAGLSTGLLGPVIVSAQTPAAAGQPATPSGDAALPDLPLEALLDVKVYAASKYLQDAAQAPASVTIVNADEIRRQGYRTLADVLRGVRGFYVTNDRNYSYVGVRGFQRPGDYNGRVLLLLNGHRMNDTVYEQALLGTESPIDVELLERVEVIRGPSSSLYGTSAFFAVINLITRTGRAVGGAEFQGQAGTQLLRRARATAGGRTARGLEGMVSVSAYGTDGNTRLFYPEFTSGDVADGIAANADRDRFGSLFASGSAGGFSGQVGVGSRTKTIPTAPYDTLFNDPRTQTRDLRGFAHARYNGRIDARTTFELRGGYDHYQYDGQFAYDTGLFVDNGRGAWVTTEAALVRQFSRHALTAGFEYRNNFRQDQAARDETGVLLDDRRGSHITGLYVEDEVRLSPRLLLNGGLRWDQYYGRFGGTVNPRLGLIATPVEGGTLKLLFGRAFRAPNPYELYYGQNALSAQLRPERIQTYEAAWEQRVTPRLQVAGSVFHNGVRGLIVQSAGSEETLDGLYYRNSDNVGADGVEFELQGELPGRVQARLAQVFQRVRLDAGNALISNSPRVLSTMVIEAPLLRTGAHLAFNAFYIGERRRVVEGVVPAAFVGNLTLSRPIAARGLGVSLTIFNVFDAAWADPGSVEHRQSVLPQDGRTAIVRLSWRL